MLPAGSKLKSQRQGYERRSRTRSEEARDILADTIVCHVEVKRFSFTHKVMKGLIAGYLALESDLFSYTTADACKPGQ